MQSKKNAFRIFLSLILFVYASQSAYAADITPTIYFEGGVSSFTAEPNAPDFTEPHFGLQDANGNHISPSHYKITFSIEGGSADKDLDGRAVSKDATTGTMVQTSYGNVTIGDKAGTVKVVITATPRSGETGYAAGSGYYTITIGKVTPTVTVSPGETVTLKYDAANTWKAFTSTLSNTITYKNSEGNTIDLSKFYDVSYTLSSGSDIVDLSGTKVSTKGKAGTATITMTCTPKSGYNTTYEIITKTITANVSALASGEKIKTHFVTDFTDENNLAYTGPNTGRSDNVELDNHLKLYDDNGNALDFATWQLKYTITEDGTKGKDQDGNEKAAWISWQSLYPGPLSGTVKVNVTLQNMDNSYEAPSLDIPIRFEQRATLMYFEHDPSTVTVHAGIAFDDRKLLNGTVKWIDKSKLHSSDESIIINENEYKYAIFVPEANAADITITNTGGKEIVDTIVNGVKGTAYWREPNSTWSIKFNKQSNVKLTYVIDYWPGHGRFVNGVQTFSFNSKDVITPKMSIDPETIDIYKGTTSITSTTTPYHIPTVTITDDAGMDVTSHYTLSYTADVSTVTADANGNLTLQGNEAGSITITVKATATKDEEKEGYPDCSGTYQIVIENQTIDEAADYKIVSTTDSEYENDATELGSLRFTKAGDVLGGSVIDGIPGLSVQFGKAGDTSWEVSVRDNTGSDANVLMAYADNVVYDSKTGIPSSGAFYVLTPHCNGYLTVEGESFAASSWSLIGTDGTQQTIAFEDDDVFKETAVEPLIAGTTYYLYNTSLITTEHSMRLRSLNFTPAFVMDNETQAPGINEATAFFNGFTGNLPRIVYKETTNVTLSQTDKDGSSDAEKATKYTTLTQADAITIAEQTANDTPAASGYVRATVLSNGTVSGKGQGVSKTARYTLNILNVPVYVVNDGDMPGVGDTVTTTNIPTAITMTFGGWDNGRGPYLRNGVDALDNWKAAKTDYVGQSKITQGSANMDNGRTFFVFPYASFGGQNASDEYTNSFNPNNRSDFNLPVRGTYVRFEPHQDGTLMLHVLQNGCIDYDQTYHANERNKYQKISWRPLYIVDETGKNVELTTYDMNNSNSATAIMKSEGADTKALLRASYGNDGDEFWDWTKVNGSEAAKNKYTQEQRDAHKALILNAWQKTSLGDEQKVLTTAEGGHVLLTKAFVRYTFKVKAGKTYFAFVEGSKLGMCGFAFLPTTTTQPYNKEADAETVTLDSSNGYTAPTTTTDEKSHVTVKLSRKLTASRWASLCLPFSIGETQFKKLFDDDAMIITFDSIDAQGVAHFTQHAYRMLVAGRPYFIKPGASYSQTSSDLTVSHVTLESGTTPDNYITDDGNDALPFRFEGNFKPATLKPYSYSIYGGKLKYKATAYSMPPFHAYILNTTGSSSAKFYVGNNSYFDDDPTGIDDITIDEDDFVRHGIIHSYGNNVYDLQGRIVRKGTTDVNGLPAGIYIVNGQKIMVNR